MKNCVSLDGLNYICAFKMLYTLKHNQCIILKKNMEYILKCPITESYVYPNNFGCSEPLTPFFVCMIAALTRIS